MRKLLTLGQLDVQMSVQMLPAAGMTSHGKIRCLAPGFGFAEFGLSDGTAQGGIRWTALVLISRVHTGRQHFPQ